MEYDVRVKLAVYRHFTENGQRPSPEEVVRRIGSDTKSVLKAYQRLRAQRLLSSKLTEHRSAWLPLFQVFRHSTPWKQVESSTSPIVPGMRWESLLHYTSQV